MNLQDLHSPFPVAEIEWRVGSTKSDKSAGLALAYLTARHVMERLDAVCGPENWQDRYEFHGPRTVCYLSVRVGGEWITKADGAGDSDVEAEKGAISDALKRAAVKWGIGRYLYDLGKIWVDLEPAGKSYRIKSDQYAKLERELHNRFGAGLKVVDAVTQPTEKAADAPKGPTVAVLKENYTRLKKELLEQQSQGWRVMAKWLNDASVLSEIEALGRYAEDFKGEARDIFDLAKASEEEFKAVLPVTANKEPDFSNLDTGE